MAFERDHRSITVPTTTVFYTPCGFFGAAEQKILKNSIFSETNLFALQEEELNNNGGAYRRMTKPCKGGARTGWPQHVWALELKQ